MSGSDDWKPGDLALCVRSSRNHGRYGSTPVGAGRPYTVIGVTVGLPGYTDAGETALILDGVICRSPAGAYHHSLFRKIHPHTPDAEDAETIALMRAKPVRQPA